MSIMSDIPFLDKGYPVMGYRFVAVIFTGLIPNPIDIEFQEISGLKKSRSVSYNKGFSLGDSDSSMESLTMKRGVFTNISPLVVMNTIEGLFWRTQLLRKDFLICCLDGDDFPVCAWVVTNAFMDSWSWDSLNATNSAVLLETMTFKYRSITYLPLKLLKTVYTSLSSVIPVIP